MKAWPVLYTNLKEALTLARDNVEHLAMLQNYLLVSFIELTLALLLLCCTNHGCKCEFSFLLRPRTVVSLLLTSNLTSSNGREAPKHTTKCEIHLLQLVILDS